MCCHRRLIYTTCGHSTFHPRPLIECQHAAFEPSVPWSTGCEIRAHAYQSLRLERLCLPCQQRRDALLREVEHEQVVRFEEWRWKVSYRLPGDGAKDYWGKKAEEREGETRRREREKRSKVKGEVGNIRSTTFKRFSWKKKSGRNGGGGHVTPAIVE